MALNITSAWENVTTVVPTTDIAVTTEITTVLNTAVFGTETAYSTGLPVTTPTADGSDEDDEFMFDDYAQRVFIATLLITASIVGIFGNTLVILSVAASRKLRTVTNIFVVNLAVADLLTSLFLPWNAVALLLKDGWPLPGTLCSAAAGMLLVSVGCSVNTLASIAFIRWIVITKSVQIFQRIFHSKPGICFWIGLTWLLPFVGTIIPPLLNFGHLGHNEKYSTCSSSSGYRRSDEYDILVAMVIYPVPLVIIVVSYIKIFMHVRRHSLHKPSETMNSEGSSSKSRPHSSDDGQSADITTVVNYTHTCPSRNLDDAFSNVQPVGGISTATLSGVRSTDIGGNSTSSAKMLPNDTEINSSEQEEDGECQTSYLEGCSTASPSARIVTDVGEDHKIPSVSSATSKNSQYINSCSINNDYPTSKPTIDQNPSSPSSSSVSTQSDTMGNANGGTAAHKTFTRHSPNAASFNKKRINCVLKRPLASIRRIRQSHLVLDLTDRELEITKNMFYIVIAFIVCLTPYALCLFIDSSDPAIPYAAAMVFFNSSLNPIIYAIKHPNFKTIFGLIVRCKLREVPAPSTWWRAMFVNRTCCCSNTREAYV